MKTNHHAAAALDHALATLPPNYNAGQFETAVRLAGAPFGFDFQQTCRNWLAVREETARAKRRQQIADQVEAVFYLLAPIAAAALWIFPTN